MNTKRSTHTSSTFIHSLVKWFSLVLVLLSMSSLPSFAMANEDAAGKVIFVFGQAWKHSLDGGKHTLKRGMGVSVGEIIQTSANGQVQIRMNDNGLIAIRPDSQFKIQAFKFSGADGAGSSDDKSYFQLLKGGFRSITGAVGQRNKKAYKVTTAVATIGIRGTDYTARVCEGDCQQADGLYVGVWQGGVKLSNQAGAVDVDAGNYGFVATGSTAPVPVQSLPADLLAAAAAENTNGNALADSGSEGNAPLAYVDNGVQPYMNPLISLPKSGTASYTMSGVTGTHYVGGVATTDTFTGNADLTANFTAQTVDANVNLGVSDGSNWQGSVTGMALNFDGSFASNGAGSGTTTNYLAETGSNGGGEITGQLTGLGNGTVPTGATMDVKIWDTFPTTGTESIDAHITLQ